MKHFVHKPLRIILSLIIVALVSASATPLVAVHARLRVNAVQDPITVPDGTEFTVVTTEFITSKSAAEGDALTFKVDDDVIVNNQVVIKKGAVVKAAVSEVKKSGMLGKGGKLNVRVESVVATDGQRIKLRASKARAGDNKSGTTVALVVLLGPIGLIKKGKNAEIPAGTRITVFTDEEKQVMPKS